jgi:hypothetical protein
MGTPTTSVSLSLIRRRPRRVETRPADSLAPRHPPRYATTVVQQWDVWPGVGAKADTMSEADSFAVSEALRYLKAKREAEGS